VPKYYIEWSADGQFTIDADSYGEAEDKAYDMVRDYVDAHQLGGDMSVYVYEEGA
jgi:hypothetical protein